VGQKKSYILLTGVIKQIDSSSFPILTPSQSCS